MALRVPFLGNDRRENAHGAWTHDTAPAEGIGTRADERVARCGVVVGERQRGERQTDGAEGLVPAPHQVVCSAGEEAYTSLSGGCGAQAA